MQQQQQQQNQQVKGKGCLMSLGFDGGLGLLSPLPLGSFSVTDHFFVCNRPFEDGNV